MAPICKHVPSGCCSLGADGGRPVLCCGRLLIHTHTHTRFRLLLRAGCGRCDVFEMNWMAVDFWVAGVAKSFESGPLPPTTPCFLFTCEKYRRGAREKFNEFYDQLAITRATLLNFAHLWLNLEGSKCRLIQFFNLISLCRRVFIHYFKRWI
jgi:hypothetical protein